MFTTLTKEETAEDSSATASHGLLLKAGFVRQSSSGIYSMLPLGLRTLEKIETIIDQELKAIGSQKLSLPVLLSAENWKKSGRWNASKGEFFRLKDRRDSDMLLSPTHEEEITQLVASELKSAKQLPIRLYQIGRKYRDEARPRAGLLRGREFVMKDLYTFDASVEDAYASYDLVAKAYQNIFQRIGVPFVVAEADSGNMGGSKSHEYHLISPAGEDTLLTCSSCGYTANEELAIGKLDQQKKVDNVAIDINDNSTPTTAGSSNNSSITHHLGFAALDKEGQQLHSGKIAVVSSPGRAINNVKIEKTLRKYFEEQEIMPTDGMLDLTYTSQNNNNTNDGPNHVFIDDSVQSYTVSGGQLIMHGPDHFRTAAAGDTCASCSSGNALTTVKAIEVGHTFYLGTKYSSTLGCDFLPISTHDRHKQLQQQKQPAEMGCYGIGISRMVATAAEVCHDDRGIVWPGSIAPYRVCIVPTSNNNQDLLNLAETIYDSLEDTAFKVKGRGSSVFYNDVVIDDRKQMFGAKMADAELIGYPFIVVLGKNALQTRTVEVNQRVQGEANVKSKIPIEELGRWLFERQVI
ncbi:hypothetical protein BDB00DRAFT_855558 [Zychaea mexicana]|uniref:uncharacterized protein n=2 Tax=Zychaea mexicana TaxID=64656 RepID=UPI0022FDD4CC|nr:uncharacterized protein BDB00DRAFT_855558 [Zychaea mexicana]KAI9484469.1 hypothetical protein BDB00DRAFT_855558 [Zychaea mexicana]